MRKHLVLLMLAGAIVLVLLAGTMAYTVDELEDIVLVQTFGRVTDVHSGAAEAGLHFKLPWPIQKTVRYDSRLFYTEDPQIETSTQDKQNVVVSMYCTWRIRPADAARFLEKVQTVDAAAETIRYRMRQKKGEVIGRRQMREIINTDPSGMSLPQIEDEILAGIRAEIEDAYGVEVTRVRIISLGLPQGASEEAIKAQKTEREQYVQQYKTAGEAQAQAIRERAIAAANQIIEFARRKAAEIETEGAMAAAELYKEFRLNEPLSIYLRSLESLKKELEGRSVIILDGSEIPAVKFFRDGPSLEAAGRLPATQPAAGRP